MDPLEQKARLLGSDSDDRDTSDDVSRSPEPKEWLDYEDPLRRRPRSSVRKAVTYLAVGLLSALVFGALGYLLGSSSGKAGSAGHNKPMRVMIVGDSISQGWEGAYTWRYRLWEWFRDNDVDVTFVGPYNGTVPAPIDGGSDKPFWTPTFGPVTRAETPRIAPRVNTKDGGYARDVDPAFLVNGREHFAVWGQSAHIDATLIAEQIRNHRPNYVFVELGFNDLAWAVELYEERIVNLLTAMESLINNARAVDPKLRFAVSNVPQRTKLGQLPAMTQDYNHRLYKAIPKWSSPGSPVEFVNFEAVYSCGTDGCPAGFDGLHPNHRGDFEIAYAFSTTLHEKYGMGRAPLQLPSVFPTHICPVPENVASQLGPSGTTFTWDRMYGVYGYDIQLRSVGTEWPSDVVNYTQSQHIDAPWVTNGEQWEARVRAYCEQTVRSPWAPTVLSVSS
ncbi:SGNH hydrolase [Thozetella sp. PMI_491]|nr:SGNH hydrolase [Thozetella sp. PMI_491]